MLSYDITSLSSGVEGADNGDGQECEGDGIIMPFELEVIICAGDWLWNAGLGGAGDWTWMKIYNIDNLRTDESNMIEQILVWF